MTSDSSPREAEIDWGVLAVQVGAIETVSTREAQLALAQIIGDGRIRASVDWYVACRSGAELARFALWRLQPPAARDRCVELWRTSDESEVRRSAVELLRVVATAEDIELVPEFLADPDPLVQVWGIGVLDQLVWSYLVEPDDAEPILRTAETHPNPDVRDRVEFVRSYVHGREVGDD